MSSVEVNKSEVKEELTLDERFKMVFEGISSLNSNARVLHDSVKDLHKVCKTACKPKKVKKHTVMHDPMKISNELLKYLDKPIGTNLTKSECMKFVSNIVKIEKLQNEENKRQFTPNKKLAKILNMKEIKTITFVELNKHLTHHFTPC